MDTLVTPDDIHEWLTDHFRQISELGFYKAAANLVFQPRNPFAPEKRREPRAGFLVAAGLFIAAAASLAYFNLVH
jgi:hypothetical protein